MDQMARRQSGSQGWLGQLLMFSGTLCFLSAAFYVGLQFGYVKFLSGKVEEVRQQITQVSREVSQEDQGRILGFYSQISNLRSILDSHVLPSYAISWFERTTVPSVYWVRFSATIQTNQVNLAGVARSMEDVISQIAVLQKDPQVQQARLNSASSDNKGVWNFDMNLTVAPSFFSGSAREVFVAPSMPSVTGVVGEPTAGTSTPSSLPTSGTTP